MAPLLRRLCAWVALVTFSSLFALPFSADSHLLAADDPGCGDGPALVNLHPFTQIESVSPPLVADHCALCHALRTFSSASTSVVVSVPHAPDIDAAVAARSDARVQTHASGRSSRAPPSFLLN